MPKAAENWFKNVGLAVGIGMIICTVRLILPTDEEGKGIPEFMVASVLYCACGYVIFQNRSLRGDGFIWKLIVITFACRSLLVFVNYHFGLFPPKQDALQNIQMANYLADNWRNGNFSIEVPQAVEIAYAIPLAWMNLVFGYNLYLGSLINVVFSLIGVFYLYQTGSILFQKQEAMIAAVVFSVMPYLNFMSISFNREILVISLMVFLGYKGLLWLRENKYGHKLASWGAFAYLALLREEAAVMAFFFHVVIFVVRALEGRTSRQNMPPWKHFVMLACILACVVAVSQFMQKGEYMRRYFHVESVSPVSMYDKAARHVDFGLAYLPETPPRSWLECLVGYVPSQTLNFLTRPFPWEVFRINQFFLVVNNFMLYVIYLSAILGGMKLTLVCPPKYSYVMLVFLAFSLTTAGLVQGNGFAAARHREQFIFFVYALAGSGLYLAFCMIRDAAKEELK